MIQNIPEERLGRIGWSLFAIMGNALPPGDPDEEDDDEDEEDEEEDREGAPPGRARAGRGLSRKVCEAF